MTKEAERVPAVIYARYSTDRQDARSTRLTEEEERLDAARQRRAAVDGRLKVIPHPRVIEGYLNDLLRLLEVDVVRGRELLLKHLGHLTLTPEKDGEARYYRISGAFNLTVALAEAKNSTALTTTGAIRAGKYGSGGRI